MYEYWFANIVGISNARKRKIRQGMKTLETLYYIEETQLKKYDISEKEGKVIIDSIRSWDLQGEYQKLSEKEIRFITVASLKYPKRLLQIETAPYALYVRGELPEESKKTVAIVGARECSPYGTYMAKEFAKVLSAAGVQIISGMARGVDSAAQHAALEAKGKTFAVLGCGVDICYPKEEVGLYNRLQQEGGILSEYAPRTPPLAQHFPARNRIISGLSDTVLVIEAKERSGSLITADMALEQGKDVYALPGPVNSRLSEGCNRLIKQGAGILLSPEELLFDMQLFASNFQEKEEEQKILLESAENIVYSCLDFTPCNTEMLIHVTKLPISELLDVLMSLELKGFVKEISKSYYVKIK